MSSIRPLGERASPTAISSTSTSFYACIAEGRNEVPTEDLLGPISIPQGILFGLDGFHILANLDLTCLDGLDGFLDGPQQPFGFAELATPCVRS